VDTITDWRKSSYSVGNAACVEAGSWRKPSSSYNGTSCIEAGSWRASSACGGGECLETASCAHGVGVRDTVLASSSPVLKFSAREWERFTSALKQEAVMGGD
jgi:hypothetical protein